MSAFVWLTWRQHRWMIIGTSVLALVAAFVLVSTEGGPVGSMLLAGFYGLAVQVAFGGVIGVFWGAPLIARELEERTYSWRGARTSPRCSGCAARFCCWARWPWCWAE